MHIADYDAEISVASEPGVFAFLSRRHQRHGLALNAFWLSHETRYPALSILVRDNLATVTYFSGDDDSRCFVSDSDGKLAQSATGDTDFSIDGYELLPSLNEQVISLEDAQRAAIEFFHCPNRPQCLQWSEL